MARGPKKHLKRLNAPKHWMLDKLSGVFAPRPTTGPHKLRECLPLVIVLRNRLKYAFTRREVTNIVMQRQIQVDNKVGACSGRREGLSSLTAAARRSARTSTSPRASWT